MTSAGLDVFALRDIGVAQARAGDVDGARRVATKIRLIASREKNGTKLEGSRNEHTTLEQFVAAIELARAEVLSEIALAQAKSAPSRTDPAR